MKLNVGCSTRKIEGFVNFDIDRKVKPDVVGNIEKTRFHANTFDMVLMNSVLEHIDMFKALEEVYRITKNGGRVIINMPHWTNGFSVYAHVQHRRGGSLFMFTGDKWKEYGFHFAQMDGRILKEGRSYPEGIPGGHPNRNTRWHHIFMAIEWLINRFPNSFERLWYPLVGGAEGLYLDLEVVK